MRLTEPIDDAGQPMITVHDAAQTIGRERPWTTGTPAPPLTPPVQEQLSNDTTAPPTPRSPTGPFQNRQ